MDRRTVLEEVELIRVCIDTVQELNHKYMEQKQTRHDPVMESKRCMNKENIETDERSYDTTLTPSSAYDTALPPHVRLTIPRAPIPAAPLPIPIPT